MQNLLVVILYRLLHLMHHLVIQIRTSRPRCRSSHLLRQLGLFRLRRRGMLRRQEWLDQLPLLRRQEWLVQLPLPPQVPLLRRQWWLVQLPFRFATAWLVHLPARSPQALSSLQMTARRFR